MCIVFNGYVLAFLKFLELESSYQSVNSLSSNIVIFEAGEHINLLLCLSIMLHVSVFIDKRSIGLLLSNAVSIAIFKYQDITGLIRYEFPSFYCPTSRKYKRTFESVLKNTTSRGHYNILPRMLKT